MLSVFIETSGKANPMDNGPFVAVAVMIRNEDLDKFKFGLQELKLLSIPQGIDVSLKTNDIIHGNRYWGRLSFERRSQILDRMMKMIEISNIKIVYSVINNKTSRGVDTRELTLKIEQMAFNELVLRTYLALRNFSNPEIRPILDRNQWDHDRKLLEGTGKLIFDQFKQKGDLGHIQNYIVEAPIFSTSANEPFIDLVNLISYVVRVNYYRIRHNYRFTFHKYFSIIQSKLYKGFDESDPKAGVFEILSGP